MVLPEGSVNVASSRIASGSNGFEAVGTLVMLNSSRCHNCAEVSWMICGADCASDANRIAKPLIPIRAAWKGFRVIKEIYTPVGPESNFRSTFFIGSVLP